MAPPGDLLNDLFRRGVELDQGESDHWRPAIAGAVELIDRVVRNLEQDGSAEVDRACRGLDEDHANAIRAGVARGTGRCESPIERQLLPWLLRQQYRFFDAGTFLLLPAESDGLEEKQVAVIPQLPIGRYRVDFALAAKRGGRTRFVIVECDGAEFHDKPEQVMRDVDRDVALLANRRVLEVVRLSGKEIARVPEEAAARVEDAMRNAWSRSTKALDEKFGARRR